jgi:hypothetical protein
VYRSIAERLAKINWESIGGRIEKEQEEGLQVSEGESGYNMLEVGKWG